MVMILLILHLSLEHQYEIYEGCKPCYVGGNSSFYGGCLSQSVIKLVLLTKVSF